MKVIKIIMKVVVELLNYFFNIKNQVLFLLEKWQMRMLLLLDFLHQGPF